MLLEMGLIGGGIPVGWLLRKKQCAQAAVGYILTWAVRILLFLLGLALGADASLLAKMDQLGLQAALISCLSVGGCLTAAWLMARYFRLDKRKNQDVEPLPASAVSEDLSGAACPAVAAETPDMTLGETPPPSGGFPMKSSLLVLGFFFAGVLAGRLEWLPRSWANGDASLWTLYLLLFSAGMGVGFDLKALGIIRELKGRILLVPLGVVAGTLAGSTVAWGVLHFFLPGGIKLPEALAVGAGFGYYSLATVIMTQMGDAALGSVALLSNMIHELITLTLSPFLVRMVGKLGPVMAGGAAAMDTCLPVIARYSGERYAIVAVFSGVALTLLVPVLVPALMALR